MTDKQHATAALLEDSTLLKKGRADVFAQRERTKRKRLLRAIVIVGVLDVYLFTRFVNGNRFQLPSLPQDWVFLAFPLLILIPVLLMVAMPLMNGKSPHIVVHPEQVEVGLTEIKGLDTQVDEVVRTLDVFLGYATFRDELGGTPRRGHPVRGPSGDREDLPRQGDGQAGGRAVPVHLGAGVPVDVAGDDGLPDPVVLQGPPQAGAQGRGRDRVHRGDRCDRR